MVTGGGRVLRWAEQRGYSYVWQGTKLKSREPTYTSWEHSYTSWEHSYTSWEQISNQGAELRLVQAGRPGLHPLR